MNKQQAHIELMSPFARADITVRLRDKRAGGPRLTIDFEPVDVFTELSISAVGYVRADRRWDEADKGQAREFVAQSFAVLRKVQELCGLWGAWHLNGLRPGHRHQRDVLALNAADVDATALPGEPRFSVESRYLTSVGKNPYRGYVYGSAWLVEPLPAAVVERVAWLVDELGGKWEAVAA